MCIFIVRVYCICIWLCFGVRQRDRKWVVCGGDSSLEGLSGSPCSSDMILAVPPPATLLLFYPLHPFTCFRASQHRQRTLLNISQRYHSSPPLQNRDVLVFAQYRISVFLASLPAVCTSHVLCKKVLTVAQSTIMGEAWTSCCLLDFSLGCVLVRSAAFRTQRWQYIQINYRYDDCTLQLRSQTLASQACMWNRTHMLTDTGTHFAALLHNDKYSRRWYWLLVGEEMPKCNEYINYSEAVKLTQQHRDLKKKKLLHLTTLEPYEYHPSYLTYFFRGT